MATIVDPWRWLQVDIFQKDRYVGNRTGGYLCGVEKTAVTAALDSICVVCSGCAGYSAEMEFYDCCFSADPCRNFGDNFFDLTSDVEEAIPAITQTNK